MLKPKQTDWDRHYIYGTLRKPTNLDPLYPKAPTAQLMEAQPYSYLDELGKWLGRTFGLMLFMALAVWMWP